MEDTPAPRLRRAAGAGVQLTFYGVDAPPPKPPLKVKVNKIPTGPRVCLIRELPSAEQPISRLEHYGAGALSTVELLAIVMGSDNLDDPATLLAANERLFGLAQLPWEQLIAIKGIGPTRAARLKATFEIGRRLVTAQPAEKPMIKSPADAANLLMPEMMLLEQEHLKVVILNTKNHVLKIHTAYIGSLNTAVMRVCELFREAIRLNAAAIVVLHNHPSSDPTPSTEDVCVTRQIVETGKLLGIDVLDHIVIGGNRYVSMKERGLGF
jgi:DNA repair protein RadC